MLEECHAFRREEKSQPVKGDTTHTTLLFEVFVSLFLRFWDGSSPKIWRPGSEGDLYLGRDPFVSSHTPVFVVPPAAPVRGEALPRLVFGEPRRARLVLEPWSSLRVEVKYEPVSKEQKYVKVIDITLKSKLEGFTDWGLEVLLVAIEVPRSVYCVERARRASLRR